MPHFRPQQELMDLAQDCVQQLDLEGFITSLNWPGVALLGVPDAAAVVGRYWPSLWPADFQPVVVNALAMARAGRANRFVGVTVNADDARRWWSVSVGPLTDSEGTIAAIGAVSRDITERVQLEASLDAINRSLRERLAVANRKLQTSSVREATLAEELAAAERAVLTSDQQNAELHDRLDLAGMARSVAERVAQQAQKGEAIGQMVAGMSHDFNNNLQTILSALDSLIAAGDMTPKQNRFIGYALTAAQHASVMSRRLLAFSRVHPYAPTPLDLGQVIVEIVPMLQGTLGKHMRIDLVSPSTPLPVFADGHLIHQGLMNLCVNARDACEGRGTIRVEFGIEHIGAEAATRMLPEGDYVFADITDDGPGMCDEVREQLFQPFFTTKPPDQGTGLGMAQVLGLMRQASGTVEVTTAVGEGTRVRLLFPRIADVIPA